MSSVTIDVKNASMLGGMNSGGVNPINYYALETQIKEKDKEIERLNNIINEIKQRRTYKSI